MKKFLGGLLMAATILTPLTPAAAQDRGRSEARAERGNHGGGVWSGQFQGRRGGGEARPEREAPQRVRTQAPVAPAVQTDAPPVQRQWNGERRGGGGDYRRGGEYRRGGDYQRGGGGDYRRGGDYRQQPPVTTPPMRQTYDRNRDGRTDRQWDRNRDGQVDRQWDRNRNGTVDRRYDRNRDGTLDRNWDRNRNGRVDQRYDRNRDGYVDRSYRYGRNDGVWSRDWRSDRRYNWRDYRQSYGQHYRLGSYYSPYRNHRYTRFSIGFNLWPLFYSERYWINDPWSYRLPEVYAGYRWVRYYDDVLLVDTYSGEVVDVIYNFFW